jgi:hypothetical protein
MIALFSYRLTSAYRVVVVSVLAFRLAASIFLLHLLPSLLDPLLFGSQLPIPP